MATEIDTHFIPSADWANVITRSTVSGTAADGPDVAGTYRAIVGIDVGDITIAAPSAFVLADWSVVGGANEGELTFTISTLPNRNGKAITKFQYALDGDQGTPTWTDLPAGISTGIYTVTGLTGGTTYTSTLAIRAVNAIDGGAVSDLKTATVAGADATGNLLSNPGFDDATDWAIINTGIAITGGKAVWTASTGGRVQQVIAEQPAGDYDWEFTISDYSAGSVRLGLYNSNTAVSSPASQGNDGVKSGTLTASGPWNTVRIYPGGSAPTLAVDDVSVVPA